MIRDRARVLRCAAISAMADLRAIYTWKTWCFAWLMRIVCQVAFFAMVGRLLTGPDAVEYLVVGNSVYVVSMTAMLVCASTAWERQTGTLPLLVAAPSSSFNVFLGRSVQWLLDGVACSAISLFALGPLFGVRIDATTALMALLIIALVGVTTYCFGLVLAGLALRKTELRNLVANVGSMSLMVLCGVQVPSTFWPAPFEMLAQFLPLTHGLTAIRSLVDGDHVVAVLPDVAMEMLVGMGWLMIAALTFSRLAEGGRKSGSVEFGE